MSSAPARFPGLDGTRALGALFVVTTHVGFHSGAGLNSTFNGVLSRMDSGVAIFFVISGFLLFRPHAVAWVEGTSRPSTTRYFWRRALRILPALWVTVLAAYLLVRSEATPVSSYLHHAALIQIYSQGRAAHGLTQMWSLATEVAFYLLLPVLARGVARGVPSARAFTWRIAVLAMTPLAGAAWMSGITAWNHPLAGTWLPGFVGWFGLGMALALWQVGRQYGVLPRTSVDTLVAQPGTLWALAAAVFLVLASPVAGPYSLALTTPFAAAVKSIGYAVFATLVVVPSVAPRDGTRAGLASRLAARAGSFLGDISYGIFCYHLIVLGLIEQTLGYQVFTGGFFLLYLPTLALTIAIAAASYSWLERPIMRWGRRIEGRWTKRRHSDGRREDHDQDTTRITASTSA